MQLLGRQKRVIQFFFSNIYNISVEVRLSAIKTSRAFPGVVNFEQCCINYLNIILASDPFLDISETKPASKYPSFFFCLR
jgi:hypothetical protein